MWKIKSSGRAKFRSVLALRGDDAIYNVTSLTPTYVASEFLALRSNFAKPNSGIGHQVPAQPQSKFDFRPVVQD